MQANDKTKAAIQKILTNKSYDKVKFRSSCKFNKPLNDFEPIWWQIRQAVNCWNFWKVFNVTQHFDRIVKLQKINYEKLKSLFYLILITLCKIETKNTQDFFISRNRYCYGFCLNKTFWSKTIFKEIVAFGAVRLWRHKVFKKI